MARVTRPRSQRHWRRFTRPLLAVFAILVITGAWVLPRAGTALVVEHDAGPPDAIIMLASHEWERLPAAAALARQHPAAQVLLTVPRVVTVHTCHRCGERVRWMESEGVDRGRIRVIGPVQNTYGEALAARDHAGREPFARLAVVTSPYHTRRALATFRAVFHGTNIGITMVPARPARGQPTRWWADPYDRFYIRYEWAALVMYRFKYGVELSVNPDSSD